MHLCSLTFITTNRELIIVRAKKRVAARLYPKPTELELANGIPIFLDQLCEALGRAQSSDVIDHAALGASAGKHGGDLLQMGLTIGQVVHDYGGVCQTVTAMAVEQGASISGEDFRTFNLCLDNAIAEAVSEYARQRENAISAQSTERPGGARARAAQRHGRSLMTLRLLIDRTLADVRLDVGIGHPQKIVVAELLEDIEIGAALHAQSRSLRFERSPVDASVTIEGDRQIISAAISNLLHNPFKYTKKRTLVSLTTRATSDRVLFEIEDECGASRPARSRISSCRSSSEQALVTAWASASRSASARRGPAEATCTSTICRAKVASSPSICRGVRRRPPPLIRAWGRAGRSRRRRPRARTPPSSR